MSIQRSYAGHLVFLIALILVGCQRLPSDLTTTNQEVENQGTPKFEIVEVTIEDIQKAITTKQITATDIVHMYLERIKTYNGVCVNQPEGILGPVSTIPNAGQINALMTLNLRPEHRRLSSYRFGVWLELLPELRDAAFI